MARTRLNAFATPGSVNQLGFSGPPTYPLRARTRTRACHLHPDAVIAAVGRTGRRKAMTYWLFSSSAIRAVAARSPSISRTTVRAAAALLGDFPERRLG